jgi:hypothetical protein
MVAGSEDWQMEKQSYFHNFRRKYWPKLSELEPYFLSQPEGSGWFHRTGNDSAGFDLLGVDGTDHLPRFHGRVDVDLSMWGLPDTGMLLIYSKFGAGKRIDFSSKGDLTKLKEWVRSLHDTPLPVGLFIPFPKAWLAVKEFIETEGQLPKSIEWVKNSDLPDGTFPDP